MKRFGRRSEPRSASPIGGRRLVEGRQEGLTEERVRDEVIWPVGQDRELSTRPLIFNPKGFLVAILKNDDACRRARAALLAGGFDPADLRIYTSVEILEDRELFLAERSTIRRVVGAMTDDQATADLYLGYASEGRGALWVHVPAKRDASRAMRYLSGHPVLHYRYFGDDVELDIPVGRSGTVEGGR